MCQKGLETYNTYFYYFIFSMSYLLFLLLFFFSAGCHSATHTNTDIVSESYGCSNIIKVTVFVYSTRIKLTDSCVSLCFCCLSLPLPLLRLLVFVAFLKVTTQQCSISQELICIYTYDIKYISLYYEKDNSMVIYSSTNRFM